MGIKETIDEQWKRINPYYISKDEKQNNRDRKTIIEILDDFYSEINSIIPGLFLRPLSSYSDKIILRGRKGKWDYKEQLSPPTIEIAKEKNIVNRWNPPDKRYLYLSIGDYDKALETVEAEMRVRPGEVITVGEFEFISDTEKKMIAEYDFDSITRSEIYAFFEEEQSKIVFDIIYHCLREENIPIRNKIIKAIESREGKIRVAVAAFLGALFLKEICDAIFIPLDDDQDCDNRKKDECYKSFHMLSEHLETKGVAGISYPSTRMRARGKNGSNLVLFDADCAVAKQHTLNTIIV